MAMSKIDLASILSRINSRLSLFESDQDEERFLKESTVTILDESGASMAGLFVFDEDTRQLVLRAGIDRNGFWDKLRCSQSEDVPRFGLEENEIGRAFTEGRIIQVDYPQPQQNGLYRHKVLVPIARGPRHSGVLILGFMDEINLSFDDENDAIAQASRLSLTFEEAQELLKSRKKSDKPQLGEETIIGQSASEGVVQGTALPFWNDMQSLADGIQKSPSKESEELRFDHALKLSLQQLEDIRTHSAADSELVAMIFTAHQLMLKDKSFVGAMRNRIHEGIPAAEAIMAVVEEYAARFAQMNQIRLNEKAQDVRDLGYRLITNLQDAREREFSYTDRIVLARHIYPSDLFRLSIEGASGLVLRGAGLTAHISILARSLEIPVMITGNKKLLTIPNGTPLLLDAGKAKLYVRPTKERYSEYEQRLHPQVVERKAFTFRGMTRDRVGVKVAANINIYRDAENARRQGSEGIGLYRSEFPFILKNDFLTEEQQFKIYSAIIATQPGRRTILRTADIGGDKLLQGRSEAESNPFLGVRGIRFSLANREMFRDQLRAMLRAGHGSDLGIMLPMVTDVEEVEQAREELNGAMEQLSKRGVAYNPNPKLGAMIELPSAAIGAEDLAKATDFLSIGTNDLTMYLLAVDRTNENLSHLYRNQHPIVLRTIADIVQRAAPYTDDISICGDSASDPVLIPFYAGIGIRSLSVSPTQIENVKRTLYSYSLAEAEEIAREMSAIRHISDMDRYLSGRENRPA